MTTNGIIRAAALAAMVATGSLALPGRSAAQDIWTLLFPFLFQQTTTGQPQSGSTATEPIPSTFLYQYLLAGQATTPQNCPVCTTPYMPVDPGMSNK